MIGATDQKRAFYEWHENFPYQPGAKTHSPFPC